jgi:hypothetical protein
MIFLWVYLALTALVSGRLAYVIWRDHDLKEVGMKRAGRVLVLDTIKWPYYILRYGLESFLRDLR